MRTILIETNGKKIIAVEVPMDAIDFTFSWNHDGATGSYLVYDRLAKNVKKLSDIQACLNRYYSEGDLKVAGIVTAKEIDFDCSELVEFPKYRHNNCVNKCASYPSDCLCEMENKTLAKKEFYSILSSKGILFVNPLGEKPNHLDYKWEKFKGELTFKSEYHMNTYMDKYDQWQQAESALWKKAVILLVE